MNLKYLPIIKEIGEGRPLLTVVCCVHGDELVGKKVIDKLNTLKIEKGRLRTIIANPLAMKKGKRFISEDLNRAFPGSKKGSIEERIADDLVAKLAESDFVLDIHSTVTQDTKNLVIIKKKNNKIRKLIATLSPEYVLFFPKGLVDNSLINYCRAGASLEYGKDDDIKTYKKSLKDIMKVMLENKMISDQAKKKEKMKCKTIVLEVQGIEKKPAKFRINKKLANLKLFKKGDIIGYSGSTPIVNNADFFPVLFGENNYKDIVGFRAKKLLKL